jgi:hypothetical protein
MIVRFEWILRIGVSLGLLGFERTCFEGVVVAEQFEVASEGPLSVSSDSGAFFSSLCLFPSSSSRYVSTSGMVGMLRYQRMDAHNYLGTQFLFLEQDLYT